MNPIAGRERAPGHVSATGDLLSSEWWRSSASVDSQLWVNAPYSPVMRPATKPIGNSLVQRVMACTSFWFTFYSNLAGPDHYGDIPLPANSHRAVGSMYHHRTMRRLFPALLSILILASAAAAAPSVAFLVNQLKTSDDYRARTQAALALGASGDEAAVKPLCDALGDSNVSVKVAAAAALGKLGKPSGLPCLKAAQAKETAPSVKSQIEKSIAALELTGAGGGSSGPATPPPPGPDAKFYVAIQVNNKTSRQVAEIDAIVRAAMQDKLLAKKGYAVAPKSETAAQGGQIVKSKKLKGFFLIATVEPPAYGGSDLSQTVRVTMWTYPDKSLQGEFAPKLTQSNTPRGDTQSENLLIKMCSENAIASFQKVAASM